MARERVIAAIDLGTTKVCVVVGGIGRDGSTEVLGVGIAPARGLKKGMIVDIEAASESLKVAIDKAERSSGFKIVSAHVGISGEHIASENVRGVVAINRADHSVTVDDTMRVIEASCTMPTTPNREIIHTIPRGYTIDGQPGVKNPVGMHGFRLEVETHIVSAAVTSVQNLTKCVSSAGIEIDDLVFQALASAETVLTEEEREMGVLLADIGGGSTDLALFVDGAVWYSASLPVGGWHLSNDIAMVLAIPMHLAEDLKVRAATAMARHVPAGDMVTIPATADTPAQQAPRRYLSEIVEARVETIIEMILAEVKRAGYDGLLPAGIVLTGGAANLMGFDQFAREFTRLPVRVGRPRGLRGLTDTVSDSAYATSVGLLLWGLKHGEFEPRATAHAPRGRRQGSGSLYDRLRSWARDLMPQ